MTGKTKRRPNTERKARAKALRTASQSHPGEEWKLRTVDLPDELTFTTILEIYTGSNGDRTLALYKRLQALGAAGRVAANLFRACKNSERAKVYRGKPSGGQESYRKMAYDRKQWSIDNLAKELVTSAEQCGLTWGWGRDPRQEKHDAVVYVDIPTGQVSFHTLNRGPGPDYAGSWDGAKRQAPTRICHWAAKILEKTNG